MKKLEEILEGTGVIELTGNAEIGVSEICFDSRKANPGSLFVAIKGTATDGHRYISQATDKGSIAVVCEALPENLVDNITYIKVKDSAMALGMIASQFYDCPSGRLKLVGVTGTNGKTTVATLLYQLFRNIGHPTGLLSTIKNMVNEEPVEATHTTPDAPGINKLMNTMIKNGCEYCFMEVSSHAIDQQRIAGLTFSGGIFTNITHEHLDYHKDFKNYISAKKLFFDQLPREAFALVNIDDKNGKIMVQNTEALIKTYSLKTVSDFKCRLLEYHFDGMLLRINGHEVWTHLIGDFNAYNILAVYGVACLLGLEEGRILQGISDLRPVRGRAETIYLPDGTIVIVDYAHTPDALENILGTINRIKKNTQKLITVVGAGGDRDRHKRPLMGKITARESDRVIFTSDNPRSEDPGDIINEMKEGIDKQKSDHVLSITDRFEAIKTALMLADDGDIVLVAGKGHETYQEIGGVKMHFDDMEVIKKLTKQESDRC